MCFNKKVVAGLAIAGLAVLVLAPNLIGSALPVLLLAACPLSMVLMMRGMNGSRTEPADDSPAQESPADRRAAVWSDADAARVRELEEEVNRLRAESNLRDPQRG